MTVERLEWSRGVHLRAVRKERGEVGLTAGQPGSRERDDKAGDNHTFQRYVPSDQLLPVTLYLLVSTASR